MGEPALRFVERRFHGNESGGMLLRFREWGYAVLRNVFERETVDAFREQVEAALVEDPHGRLVLPDDSPLMVWPTRAPRMRQILPGALHAAAMKAHPSMFESAWVVARPGEPVGPDAGWHKDRDHEGMPGREYHYPKDIHIGAYFTDMTAELGPTEIVPRSHFDQTRSPFSGAERHAFTIHKEDIVLWDQRAWHRGTPRLVPGFRIFAIFGFHSVPVYGDDRRKMPESQRQAWLTSDDPEDQVLYGGTFGRR